MPNQTLASLLLVARFSLLLSTLWPLVCGSDIAACLKRVRFCERHCSVVGTDSWCQVTFAYGEGWEGDINFRGLFKTFAVERCLRRKDVANKLWEELSAACGMTNGISK